MMVLKKNVDDKALEICQAWVPNFHSDTASVKHSFLVMLVADNISDS